jgi:hypothetical protein
MIPKISARAACSAQTKPTCNFKNTISAPLLEKLLGEDIEVEYKRVERKKAQLIM